MKIVEIEPKYADYVKNIIRIRWENEKDEYVHEVDDYLNPKKLSKCFVAVENDKSIGMYAFHISNDIGVDLHPWCIGLWVEPDKRGKGIGYKLSLRIFSWARMLGYKKIYLDTINAENYHLKFGWKNTGIMGNSHGEKTIVMEYDL